MARKRYVEQLELDQVILDHLRRRGGGWVTAAEAAMEVGYPKRVVAHALIRLAKSAEIESQVKEWVSGGYRVRRCAIYRVFGCTGPYPAWLMPVAPTVAAGQGRIVRLLGE